LDLEAPCEWAPELAEEIEYVALAPMQGTSRDLLAGDRGRGGVTVINESSTATLYLKFGR
jgi:hypothetical protein